MPRATQPTPRHPLTRVFWGINAVLIAIHLYILFWAPIPQLWRTETRYTFIWLSTVFCVGFAAFALTWRDWVGWWRGQGEGDASLSSDSGAATWGWLRNWPRWAVAAIAAVWVATHVPPKYRMLADEQSHLSVAQAFYHYGRAERCVEAHYFDRSINCEKFENEIRPKTYPLTVSYLYSLLGEDISRSFWLNFALYLTIGFILARIASEATQSAGAALFAQAAWYLWPLNAWWARAAGYEMSYCFWLSLTFLLALAYRRIADGVSRDSTLLHQILLGSVAALAIQTRPDALLSVAVTMLPAAWTLLAAPRAAGGARGGAFALTLLGSIYPWSMLRGALREWDMDVLPKGAPPFSWNAFSRNLYPNLDVVFNLSGEWPSSQTLALFGIGGAVLGFVVKSDRGRAVTATAVAWVAATFGLFTAFQHGRMNLAVSMRYATCLYPALSILSGIAAASVLRRFPPLWGRALLGAVAAILLVRHAPIIEDEKKLESVHLPNESRIIAREAPRFPAESVFVYSRAPDLILQGRSAYLYPTLVQQDPDKIQALTRRSNGNLIYVRGLDCWQGATQQWQELRENDLCAQIERKFKLEKISAFRVGDQYELVFSRVGDRLPTVAPSQAPAVSAR